MGSIHLGGISRFGEKAGSQCTCNAFYYLFWCRVRSVAFWKCSDLDMVLIFGDKLYKSLDTAMHLHVDEVSRTILHYEIVCHTTLSNLDDWITTLAENFVLENFELMFNAGYTIPIFRLKNDLYYDFDSHSCDERYLSKSMKNHVYPSFVIFIN